MYKQWAGLPSNLYPYIVSSCILIGYFWNDIRRLCFHQIIDYVDQLPHDANNGLLLRLSRLQLLFIMVMKVRITRLFLRSGDSQLRVSTDHLLFGIAEPGSEIRTAQIQKLYLNLSGLGQVALVNMGQELLNLEQKLKGKA